MDNPIIGLLITLILVLANAFFVAAEFALVKVRSSQMELRAQAGSRAARVAQHILAHLGEYLSGTQLGITLASLGLGWVGEPIVAKLLIDFMSIFGVSVDSAIAHNIALPLAFVLITFFHIIIGELAPKSIAIRNSEQTSIAIAVPLRAYYALFKPAIMVLNWVATRTLRLFGIDPIQESEHSHSGEELRLLLEQSREGGTIEETEHELIENVFEFGDTIVKEVMIPRTNIIGLDINRPQEEIVKIVIEDGYTRMPVYDGSVDNVVGVIYSKDLITLMLHQNLIVLQDLIRPPYFIPETKLIQELLRDFQRMKIHLAVVVDEFGGTAGLVTMEDILEELVGEIQDEYDEESTGIEKVGESTYVVDASMSISDVNDAVEGFVLPESEDYTTIGGLVNKWFGHIPEADESCERDAIRMTVLKTVNRRAVQVKIEDLKHDQPDNGLEAFKDEEESA